MKHLIKTTIFSTILFFVLGSSLIAQNETTDHVQFVYKDDVAAEFWAYIDTMTQLPEPDSVLVQHFLDQYKDYVIFLEESDIEHYENNQNSNKTIQFYRRGIEITEQILDTMLMYKKSQLEPDFPQEEEKSSSHSWIWIVAAVLFSVLLFFLTTKKREKVVTTITPPEDNDKNNNSDIIVRRKTTSVLKKQSLEDVIDNENYMKIDCDDFCNDSAVRRMYIKNTCIKEIYNMYAEDLRNPDNPKEDGCMVLGRWVYDQEADEYYVSLEHVVFPGDDAVFAEYELNFGAKIKLNIMTKLRKLRQETQLQYDLTCWVHSHPGIGVFFSNTDYNLHMLHKHPTHPKFLTAIVVDILTPQQELGIFTFKHDMGINSKAELKKTYSLEEWHKWAVESVRNAFKPEDHFNTLQEAKARTEACHDIQLSNGAIIDMSLLATEHQDTYIGDVHGFVNHKSGSSEYIATKVSTSETAQNQETIGSFVIVTHCSIPSVRKALADRINNIGFVLVYSTTDGLLTSIPVINHEICTDHNFYGEQQLEDLKIWTRRKR